MSTGSADMVNRWLTTTKNRIRNWYARVAQTEHFPNSGQSARSNSIGGLNDRPVRSGLIGNRGKMPALEKHATEK
ncbi:MAG: hypothetical protein KDK28_09030, partial [Maritimibacter sp.]|nr:hypothetical protein [Maritimibacter sp.]